MTKRHSPPNPYCMLGIVRAGHPPICDSSSFHLQCKMIRFISCCKWQPSLLNAMKILRVTMALHQHWSLVGVQLATHTRACRCTHQRVATCNLGQHSQRGRIRFTWLISRSAIIQSMLRTAQLSNCDSSNKFSGLR